MFLAAGGMPRLSIILLILGCMVSARTFAMAANRLFDAKLDAVNPRTARRAIPSGQLSRGFYISILAACGFAFLLLASGFWLLAISPATSGPSFLKAASSFAYLRRPLSIAEAIYAALPLLSRRCFSISSALCISGRQRANRLGPSAYVRNGFHLDRWL